MLLELKLLLGLASLNDDDDNADDDDASVRSEASKAGKLARAEISLSLYINGFPDDATEEGDDDDDKTPFEGAVK